MDFSFEAPPDKIIDYDSLRLRYLKFIPIDLTDRVRGYLNNNRLVLKDIKVLQGQHCLQLLIAYTAGEETLMEIFLYVFKWRKSQLGIAGLENANLFHFFFKVGSE